MSPYQQVLGLEVAVDDLLAVRRGGHTWRGTRWTNGDAVRVPPHQRWTSGEALRVPAHPVECVVDQ